MCVNTFYRHRKHILSSVFLSGVFILLMRWIIIFKGINPIQYLEGIIFEEQRNEPNKSLLLYGVELNYLKNNSYYKTKPLVFLEDYKNPCWVETLPTNFMQLYQDTPLYYGYGKKLVRKLSPVYQGRLDSGDPWRLRCLPYVYLAGVTKSGTTDLFRMLNMHPDVYEPWVKEPMYWNRARYPVGVTVHKIIYASHGSFNEYLNYMDLAAHLVNTTTNVIWSKHLVNTTTNVIWSKHGPTHNKILVDGSSYLIWEDNGWPQNPGNRGLKEPVYTTAKALYAAQPQARIMVLLRHPTDRLYSAYTMYQGNQYSAQRFHVNVQQAINEYTNCSNYIGWRACFYDVPLSNKLFPVSLRSSLYSVFLKDWFDVFPRDQMMIIKSEDYYSNRMVTMKGVFLFLGLDPIADKLADKIQVKKPSFKRKYHIMWNSTRQLLNEFFLPFNKDLENLLGRKMWEEHIN